ncbi:hypothetical protein [Subtercola lobariae]|uniref:hypothetical protein n=1 Tax=Subtercola lobariae TaxID=1588641 RepID=UPI001664229B|nr:hypothetical protein [Subtercola lobariae]
MTSSEAIQVVTGGLIVSAMVGLFIFRRAFFISAAWLHSSLGERVARNMNPTLVLVGSIAGLFFGIGVIVSGIVGYRYSPPTDIGG